MSQRRRVLINGLTIHLGGIRNLYFTLLPLVAQADPETEYFVLLPAATAAELPLPGPNFHILPSRRLSYNRRLRVVWEQTGLPLLARRLGIDILVSATNYGPRFPLCRQVVCLFNALYYSEEYQSLLADQPGERASLGLQRSLVGLAIAGSKVILVQQPGMIEAVRRFFPSVPANRFRLMPNAASPAPPETESICLGLRERLAGRVIINGIAHYNPHRNLEVMLAAMARLREAGRRDFVLLIAAGADDNPPGSARFVREAGGLGDDLVFNFGRRLSLAETYAALRESDIMVYPSLAESFSAAYLMAMECDVPLVAADLEFARAICGEAAVYFQYDRAEDLAARLIELAGNPARRADLIAHGREQRRAYTWDRMLAGFLDGLAAADA